MQGHSQTLRISPYLSPSVITPGYEGEPVLGFTLEDAIELKLLIDKGDFLANIHITALESRVLTLQNENLGLFKQVENLKRQIRTWENIEQVDQGVLRASQDDLKQWKTYAKKRQRRVFIYRLALPIVAGAAAYYSSPPRNDRKNAILAFSGGLLVSIILK